MIGNYVASLAGMRRNSLDWPTRAFGLVCSALSIPIQFVPLLVATIQKSDEAGRVAQYDRAWAVGKRPLAPPDAAPAAERA